MSENETTESAKADQPLPSSSSTAKGEHIAPDNESSKKNEPELSSKEAYFLSLSTWVKQANISHNAMALFPWYLMSSYPQMFQNQAGYSSVPNSQQQMPNMGANGMNAAAAGNLGANASPVAGFGVFRIFDEQAQADFINRVGGYEYIMAPFWKRAIAEIIDVVILLLLKVIFAFTVMNIFDMDLGYDFDKEVIRKAMDDNDYSSFLSVSMDFLAFSSDLLILEILTKIIVCFYEAMWTAWHAGATPGKAIMNLRIQYVEAVLPLQPPQPPQLGFQMQRVQMRALVYPAETPSFKRAMLRAIAKNLIMTLFLPLCFIMIFFKNNRTAYDYITKTIVVETNPNAELRRQQRQ